MLVGLTVLDAQFGAGLVGILGFLAALLVMMALLGATAVGDVRRTELPTAQPGALNAVVFAVLRRGVVRQPTWSARPLEGLIRAGQSLTGSSRRGSGAR